MKESTIYEFDPAIYPRKVWVAVTDDTESLKNFFYFDNDVNDFYRSFDAVVFPVYDLDKSNNGVLVIFASKKQMTVKTIAHESVHVATQIFSDCNMGFSFEAGMDEHFAYLVGWAADCMNNIRTGNVQNLKTLSNQK